MKAIAIDDEVLALKVIANFCEKLDFITLEKTFHKPNEALRYLAENDIDLLFLDINMPALTGIELYKSLKKNTLVIFTTAFSEYAVEGFNLNAVDYLLKPFTFERFLQGVNKAHYLFKTQEKTQAETEQYIFIRADYSLHKIALNQILYIEGLDDYLKIHLQNAKPIVARITMKAMLEKLPEKEYIRVHRSFIVPFARIDSIRNKTIQLGNEEIPIGVSYEKEFFQHFK